MAAKRGALRRGFTLIELLVVIAIISILAGILFPTFARARESARQTACRSNVKQLATAVMMYAEDYDESLPPAYYSDGTNFTYWPAMLNPYVKSGAMYKCPSDPVAANTLNTSNQLAMMTDSEVSYGFNWISLSGVSLAGIAKPSDTVSFVDCGNYAAAPNPTPPAAQIFPNRAIARHNEMVNTAFMDGHVKSMKYERLNEVVTDEEGATGLTISAGPPPVITGYKLWNLY
jgi:prepilin-type N-terminal cleavage/methylation domain-containing protein/prepilin-type processing-associated H-X9-DG protein